MFADEEKERCFRIEKDMLERYEKDLNEQEAYDKDRKKKRKEYEEEYQTLYLRLTVVREEQIYAELEDEQLMELIQQEEFNLERYDELDKRRLIEIEERRKLESDRQKEVESQIEFEREQKALFDQLDKKQVVEYDNRYKKVKAIQAEAEKACRELSTQEDEERTLIIKLQSEQDMDSKRILKIGIEESEKIARRLKELQEDERARKQMKRQSLHTGSTSPTGMNQMNWKQNNYTTIADDSKDFVENEFIDDEINDLGLSEDDLEDQMDDLFKDSPIEFRPRKFNNTDQMIATTLGQLGSPIPVVAVSGTLYVVGSHVVNLLAVKDKAFVERSTGNIKLDDFILENNLKFQRNLVLKMMKSNESLEFVMDSIIKKFQAKGSGRKSMTNGRSPGGRSPKNRYF